MAIASETAALGRWLGASLDVDASAEEAFELFCAVEKWPVWLSFLRSARLAAGRSPVGLGSEVVIRSSVPGAEEEVYEVDALTPNYRLSLVGAYSTRRRLDFRIERRTSRARVHVRLAYPAYHGKLGELLDGWRHRRKLTAALNDALVHFKGLVEYRRHDAVLADL
ncbi:MAG TPA: hypothetical protein VGF86_07750 [Candidatus Tumulicola sp.]|jgi:hypothetical protein